MGIRPLQPGFRAPLTLRANVLLGAIYFDSLPIAELDLLCRSLRAGNNILSAHFSPRS